MNDNEDIFHCFSVPIQILTMISKNDTFKKVSATFFMNEDDCEQIEIYRNGWYVMEISIRKKSQVVRILKLVYVKRFSEIKSNEIIISDEMLYNVMNNLGSNDWRFKLTIPLHIKSRRIELNSAFLPSKAHKVSVCTIAHNLILKRELLDLSLMSYFQKPSYVCKGDVITIDVSKYVPEISLDFSKSGTLIYIKIVEIEGPVYDTDGLQNVVYGFIIDKNTTLYQTSTKQGFVPNCKYRYIPSLSNIDIRNIKHVYPKLLPQSFTPKFEILLSWIQQLTKKECNELKFKPFFLLHGPHGVGKSQLLSSICTYVGMGYLRFSCKSCEGLAPGQGEGKIKALFTQVNDRTPCILQLEDIEALCYNADGDEDIRTLNCLQHILETMKYDLPVVVVATTSNLEAVKPCLVQLFLQTLYFDTPDETQRLDILKWIFKCSNYKVNLEILQQVSAQTAGFVFNDLSELVSCAYRERIKRLKIVDSSDSEHTEEAVFEVNDFITVIGSMQAAFSEAIGAPKIPNVKWEDVGALSALKKEILGSLRSTKWDTELKRSGLLLHGPPGTGKTLLAKAVATECGRNFLSVKGPELLNMYVGQSEQNIRRVFEIARSASPCIIFFDELDSLAPKRGRSGDSGGVMDRVVSQLLAEMDGLSSSGDVFILGATNRPDLIDSAIRRPGRLDKMLYVGPCSDRETQISVFKALTRKFQMAAGVDLLSVANMIPECVTGADIYAVCSAAWINAARRIIQGIEDEKNDPERKIDEKKKEVVVEQMDFVNAVNTCKYATKPK